METKRLGWLALLVALATSLWVILLIVMTATSGQAQTLLERIAMLEAQKGLYLLNYANAGLITLGTAAFMAGLYSFTCAQDPFWAVIGLVFVPVYAGLNLVVYLSQVFLIPGLLAIYDQPQTNLLGELLLGLAIHDWPGSAAGFLNALAYAVLGVPSTIFGVLLVRRAAYLRAPGLLLVISAVLSWLALVGVGVGSALLAGMTLVSGLVFLLALIWLGIIYFRFAPSAPSKPGLAPELPG